MGRCTVTGMLTASGRQFKDWTAAYRLFGGERMDVGSIFGTVRRELMEQHLMAGDSINAHMDDTRIRKRGKKVSGTTWHRDPLGPPFQTNFIWAQRFIQISLSLPDKEGPSQSRGIPVDFHHCPSVKKPKKGSDPETVRAFREIQEKAKLSRVGSERIGLLRKNLDGEGYGNRHLFISVDGSYTNETVLKRLPKNTTLIGRIRKDAKLNLLPGEKANGAGRHRVYGQALPTPEQIRQSGEYPWQEVDAWAAGKIHTFNVKVVNGVRWRKAGKADLQLVVIRPLSYRLNSFSKLLYRNPAYLVCTDSRLETEKLLQSYLWRWEIEVNFRDEKTLMGCGQAQVRKEKPVEKVPAFVTAVYAMMLLASNSEKKELASEGLPRPKWYRKKVSRRTTTGDLINRFKASLWAGYANINFSDFVKLENKQQSRSNLSNPTYSSMFYNRN